MQLELPYMKIRPTIKYLLLIIFFVFLSILGFSFKANASVMSDYDFFDAGSGTNAGMNDEGTNYHRHFTASSTTQYATGMRFILWKTDDLLTEGNIVLNICDNSDCDTVYGGVTYVGSYISTSTKQQVTFDFAEPLVLYSYEEYYIELELDQDVNQSYFYETWVDGVGDFDLQFEFYDDDLFDFLNIDTDRYLLSDTIPDFYMPDDNVCFVGEQCNVWFYYNDLMIDEGLWLVRNIDEFILDDLYIEYTYNNEMHFTIASEATSTQYDVDLYSPVCYDLVIDGVDFGGCGIRKGGYQITWLDKESYLPDFSIFDDPCWNVATSSGSYADDFRYGIECGALKVIAWVIEPPEELTNEMYAQFSLLTQNFPISWVYDINATFDDLKSTTTEIQASSIPLVFWWNEDTDSLELKASGEITTTTVSTLIGDEKYNTFYDYMHYFIIFFGVLYFILRLLTMSFNAQKEV